MRAARAFRLVLPLVLPLVVLGIWWFTSERSTSLFYPPLSKVLTRLLHDWVGPSFAHHLVPSFVRLTVGFVIAVIVGISLGVILGLNHRLRRNVRPVLEYLRATPTVALIPLAFLVIGPGAWMEIALIAFASVWPILVATSDGVSGADPTMLDTAKAYGLDYRQRVQHVVLPAATPQIMSGIHIATQFAVALMILANFIGSDRGLGFFVLDAQTKFDVVGTWAGLIVIGLVGVAVTVPVLLAQRYLLAWHRGWRAAEKVTT